MLKSLPLLISEAVKAGQFDIARGLVNEGLHLFPGFSYYKFLANYLNFSLSHAAINSSSYVKVHQIVHELWDSWNTEIGSNHYHYITGANNNLIRDSSYLILKGRGLSVNMVEDRNIITLTREFAGFVFHGPYRSFLPGSYELTIEFELKDNSIHSEDFNFACTFDVSDYDVSEDSNTVIYSIDSQSMIKDHSPHSNIISHKVNLILDVLINSLVIRALVVVPANVNLFLPRLSLVSD